MSKKTSPRFTDGMPYNTWKNEIDMWKIVTSIPKEQVITVLLESLESNVIAEKAASELTATDVDTENGMTILINSAAEPPRDFYHYQTRGSILL